MLMRSNPKNFKSSRDGAFLDLSIIKITEHEDHAVELASDKPLKVVAIYGISASGKFSTHDASKFMSYCAEESFKFGGESDSRQETDPDYTRISPFLFDSKSRGVESTFEVFFVNNSENTGKTYRYGFAL